MPPSIIKDISPRSVLCAKETPCSLLCHATGDIPFNYSWTRNSQALDGHKIKVMNNIVIITPLDDQDYGDYVCHATNSFGSTSYKITLSESREEVNSKWCQCEILWTKHLILYSYIWFRYVVFMDTLLRQIHFTSNVWGSSIWFFDRARSGCEHSASSEKVNIQNRHGRSIRSHDFYLKRCVKNSLTWYNLYVIESRASRNYL